MCSKISIYFIAKKHVPHHSDTASMLANASKPANLLAYASKGSPCCFKFFSEAMRVRK